MKLSRGDMDRLTTNVLVGFVAWFCTVCVILGTVLDAMRLHHDLDPNQLITWVALIALTWPVTWIAVMGLTLALQRYIEPMALPTFWRLVSWIEMKIAKAR